MIQVLDFVSTSCNLKHRDPRYELESSMDIHLRLKHNNIVFTRTVMLQKGFQTAGYSVPRALSFLAPRLSLSKDSKYDIEYNSPILVYQALCDCGSYSGFTPNEAKDIFSGMINISFASRMKLFIARAYTLFAQDRNLDWGTDFLDNSGFVEIIK